MDTGQLFHLLQLIDDDSPGVQAELGRQLGALGGRLNTELARLSVPPTAAQRRQLQDMLRPQARETLSRAWDAWLGLPEDAVSLEKACALLSEFQTGCLYPDGLEAALDRLTEGYRAKRQGLSAAGLSAHLFQELGLRGGQDDYYNPLNSDLAAVIHEGKGIPLSLTLVYMLCGRRLGLDIGGCDFPGHFLARVREDGREYLVDCFSGGAEVDPQSVGSGGEAATLGAQEALSSRARPRAMVARMLRNLAKAFETHGRTEDVSLMAELSVRLERDDLRRAGEAPEGVPAGPRFRTGTVVRGTRWRFRAVVVDFDLSCKAPETWRRRKVAGARLEQAWYHLFLDQSDQVAYAPEDSLEAEEPAGTVEHPLMDSFFERFADGKYWRNLKAWPGA